MHPADFDMEGVVAAEGAVRVMWNLMARHFVTSLISVGTSRPSVILETRMDGT